MSEPASFIAHIKRLPSGEVQQQKLEDHLYQVAELASQFASEFSAGEWAYLAGLWHDLGKYSNDFQKYIRTTNDLDSSI